MGLPGNNENLRSDPLLSPCSLLTDFAWSVVLTLDKVHPSCLFLIVMRPDWVESYLPELTLYFAKRPPPESRLTSTAKTVKT